LCRGSALGGLNGGASSRVTAVLDSSGMRKAPYRRLSLFVLQVCFSGLQVSDRDAWQVTDETDLSAFRAVFRLVLSGLVEPGGIFGEVLQAGECAAQQFG